jgi:subtilisin family serine protease
MLRDAALIRRGGRITFTGSGWHLDKIMVASFKSTDHSQLIPLRISCARRGGFVASGFAPSPLLEGYLQVSTGDGFFAAYPISPEPDTTRTGYARDRLIIRFGHGTMDLPSRSALSAIDLCTFSDPAVRDSLAACGVSQLRAALPTFSHADVHVKNASDQEILTLEDLSELCIAQIDPALDPRRLARRVAALPGVIYAEPDVEVYPTLSPNDPLYGQQWGLHSPTTPVCGIVPSSGANIQAEPAWDQTTGLQTVGIAIVDSGIDSSYADFRSPGGGRVRYGPNYVIDGADPVDATADGHGTAVTGIACATGNDASGIVGVAWNVTPWAVKVFPDDGGPANISSVNSAIDWARSQHIPIVNFSGATSITVPPDTGQVRSILDVCLNARKAGMLIVAAMGNLPIVSGQVDSVPLLPASSPLRVCAVGAAEPDGNLWRDDRIVVANGCTGAHDGECGASNWGSWMDFTGPGGQFITTTWNNLARYPYHKYFACPSGPEHPTIGDLDTLSTFSGTSAAAPFVAGAAALLLSRRPEMNADDVEHALKITAFNINGGTGVFTVDNGYGMPRTASALNYISSPKALLHFVAGLTGSNGLGAFAIVDSTPLTRTFVDVPAIGSGPIQRHCWRYKLRLVATLPASFVSTPSAWVTAAGSSGWADTTTFNYDYEVPTGSVTNVDASHATLTTFVYRFPDTSGHHIGWLPADPSGARLAFTVLGYPTGSLSADNALISPPLSVRALPNPAIERTSIAFSIPSRGAVTLQVYDAGGRLVRHLARDVLEPGKYRVPWDGRADGGHACQAGLYFCRIEHAGQSASGTIVLLGARH